MNEVTAFMYFMYNRFTDEECRRIFGTLSEHIFEKYIGSDGDVMRFYSWLDTECRDKLVKAATEYYGKGN
jgi:hypothetical protein